MPQFSYPVPDVYQMITRPVIVAIVKQIMGGTGISDDAFIEYKGEHSQTPTWRSFIDSKNPIATNDAKMPFIEKIQIEVDENPLEEFILSTPYHYPDNKKVWEDPILGIVLSPFYERAEYTINFTYRTPDKGTATAWRTNMMRRMKVKFSDMSMIARYQIIIPHLILRFLKQFYTMRENISGYGDDWNTYFVQRALQKMVKLVDQAGNNPEIAIDETQLDILGNFQFTDVPKEERLDDGSCYTISFSYKFRFDHPKGFVLKYPLVIHNQLMPQAFRPEKPHRYDPHSVVGNSSQSMSRYDVIIQQMGGKKEGKVGGNLVPWFDDWSPKLVHHKVSPLLQLLCKVNPDDPTSLIDLRQLQSSGLKFSDTLGAFMVKNHRTLNRHAAGPIFFAVYVNDDVLDQSQYYITKDLVVRTRNTLDMRDVHHVVVFAMTDILSMTPDGRKELARNPEMFKEIVQALEPSINTDAIEVLAGKLIPDAEFQRVASFINTSSTWYNRDQSLVRPLALSSLVQKTT